MPPGRSLVTAPDDHGWNHLQSSYRDAVDYLDAVRQGDGHAMHAVEDRTACDQCFVESLAQIGARLGDRAAAERAASAALDLLRQDLDTDR